MFPDHTALPIGAGSDTFLGHIARLVAADLVAVVDQYRLN